jgi:sugar/nucleoside kinase (ribokinase family)
MNPRSDEFTLDHLYCQGAYLQGGIPQEVSAWVARLRDAGCPFILWEPWDQFCLPENRAAFSRLAKMVDAVSPNLLEGRELTGLDDPQEVIQRLVEDAPIAMLRMGQEGSLVFSQADDRVVKVFAVPVQQVVDVTGAGNAYCGGFLAGYCTTGNLVTAAKCAAISASFALRQYGALYSMEGLRQQAQSMFDTLNITAGSF